MTDLVISDDQRQYQELARDFSQKEIASLAASADHSQQIQIDVCKHAWDIGLFNVRVPEELGGLGLPLLDACVITEEIGAVCTGIGAAFEANEIGAAPLLVAGTEEQKAKFLQPLTNEFNLVGYSTESIGDNLAKTLVQATRSGDNFVLNGETLVANGSNARWFWTAAQSDEGTTLLFIVPTDYQGIEKGSKSEMLGRRAADFRTIRLRDVSLDSSHLINSTAESGSTLDLVRLTAKVILSAEAVGLARAAMQNALAYSKERFTFGQPIVNYQAVNFMLADMAKDIEAGRLMTWKSAHLFDQGEPSAVLCTEARIFTAEAAMRIATDAVQIYGGYGYSREYPVEKLMRDAKMFQIHSGDIHNQRVSLGKQLISASAHDH